MIPTLTVSWFSAGVSSAVATWLVRDEVDRIIYTHIDDQHPDTLRFVRDCEQWFGKPVEVLQSPYKNVENALLGNGVGYVNGPTGAPCTKLLKRRVRAEWERENRWFTSFRYVWGLDIEETKPRPPRGLSRVDGIREAMPQEEHLFPLVDAGVTKADAHGILRKAGIKRPAMYDLGYRNNNCVGCVKGGKHYWNKIRVDFPEVFKARAELERKMGHTCLKKVRERPQEPASADNSVLLYLDELDPAAGRDDGPIVDECGIMCEILK